MTGHLLGAAGAVEAIACAMTIETGKVHPTINLVEPEDELKELGLLERTAMIERCGLSGEKIYEQAADAEETGYFAVLLVK